MFRTSIAAVSVLGSAALAVLALSGTAATAAPAPGAHVAAPAPAVVSKPAPDKIKFSMARAAGVVKAGCIPNAKATVRISSDDGVETMNVHAYGLPKKTEFDLFVLQVPDAPFGLAWYQGDLETNSHGEAWGTFKGRFNIETFSIAAGTAPAPVTHSTPPRNDASSNPVTAPVHQYHLGFWFNSPADAAKAGCGNAVTPFNGEHNAGTQAMSTRNFPIGAGPLSQLNP
jgi:hypothetical protein